MFKRVKTSHGHTIKTNVERGVCTEIVFNVSNHSAHCNHINQHTSVLGQCCGLKPTVTILPKLATYVYNNYQLFIH